MITGCPTAMSAPEARLLQRYADGRRVVEAGALLGYSTIRLAQVAARVVSIDRHEGYSAPTYRRFRSNIERAGVSRRVTPVVGDAVALLPQHAADLAFIDLTGQLALTAAAMKAAQARLVAVHDLGRAYCQVDEAIVAAGFRVVEAVDTLAVCERVAA